MSFPRNRAPGLWTFDSVVTSAEFETFDANLANALDGLNGGAYSLQHTLSIGGAVGAFFDLELPAVFNSTVVVNGAICEVFSTTVILGTTGANISTFGSTLDINSGIVTIGNSGADALVVSSFSRFTDIVNFDGSTFFTDPASFSDNVAFGDDVVFNGTNLDINSGIVNIGTTGADAFVVSSFTEFNSTVDFNDDAIFGALAQLDGGALLRSKLTMSGSAAIAQRVVAGNNTDSDYSPLTVHEVIMPDGVLTGSSDWNIIDAGECPDGCEILFTNKDTTGHTMSVRKPGGVQIAQLFNSAGQIAWGRFVKLAGVWTLAQGSALNES